MDRRQCAALIAAVALAGLASVAIAQPARTPPPDQVARGHALVHQNCNACHAVEQADDSPNPLAPPLRSLGGLFPRDNLARALAQGVHAGHAEMPSFHFDEADSRAIEAYLESIQVR